jgi:adenine/guanine/hypoxanthine permease
LIIVGALMATEVRHINWSRLEIVIPTFITIIMMPLTFSVATGIALGFVLYPLAMISLKKWKDVHPIMYILCALFIIYFAFS